MNLSIPEPFDPRKIDPRLLHFMAQLSGALKRESNIPLGHYDDFYGFRIYEGYRSKERQDFLYEQGRTKPGPIVTKARAGQSAHNYGMAVDLCDINLELKKAEIEKTLLGNPAIEWGGHWKNFPDPPHFQIRNWKKEVLEKR